jgi:dCMP deaminase
MAKRDWDEYFMKIAEVVASMATCDRKHVGAVIVVNKTVVSTGFNGAPRGMPHCDDVGHELKDMGGRQSCVRTVHGEANALVQAARSGVKVEGGTLYTTASPCYDCLKLIINAGVIRIVCKEFYASRYGMSGEMESFAKAAGAQLVFLSPPITEEDLTLANSHDVVTALISEKES